MKVLFLAGWYPNEENPIEGTFVREHAKAAALFNEVAVIHGREIRGQKERYRFSERKENGFLVVRFTYRRPIFRSSYSVYIRGVLRVFNRLKEKGFVPQIVHANIFFTAFPATILKRTYGIPFVITEHYSRFLFPHFNRGKLKQARWMKEAATIMPVSRTLQKGMESHGIKGNFTVIPNAIDTNIFCPAPGKDRNKNVKKIITVARLTPDKGIGNLLKALKEVKNKRNDFFLNIIGDGKSRHDFEKMAAEFDLSPQVCFLGNRDKREIAAMMRESDFFVLPTHHRETFCCVFAEAMACGLPIIGTTAWAVPEFFGKPEFGILVPPKDIDRLAQAIDRMLNNHQEYDSLKISQYVRENFGHNAVGGRLTAIYRQTVLKSQEVDIQ